MHRSEGDYQATVKSIRIWDGVDMDGDMHAKEIDYTVPVD